MKFQGKEVKSETVRNSKGDAEWKNLSSFILHYNQGADNRVVFSVWDYDSVSADDLLGAVVLDLSPSLINAGCRQYPIQWVSKGKPPAQELGFLLLQLDGPETFGAEASGSATATHTNNFNTAVRVAALRSQRLLLEDGKSVDAFVTMKFQGKEMQTEVVTSSTGDVVWRKLDPFVLQYNPVGDNRVVFSVYDYDRISANDLIGLVQVDLKPEVFDGKEQRYPIRPYTKGAAPAELGELWIRFDAGSTGAVKNEDLAIMVVGITGKGLYLEDGKTVDPYVVIQCGKVTAKSEVVRESKGDAAWKNLSAFTFPWDGTKEPPILNIQVYDWDRLSSDDLIGIGNLPIQVSMFSAKEVVVPLSPGEKGAKYQAGELRLTLHYNGLPKEAKRSDE
eukprot:PhF_6_TR1969/c0_g1_i3/m.3257